MPKTTPGVSENGLSRRNMFRITAGLAAAGALFEFTGCTPSASAPNTSASGPAVPGAGETAKEDARFNKPVTPNESDVYKKLTAEQKAEIDNMASLDVSEFDRLSYEDRYKYAHFIEQIVKPYATAYLEARPGTHFYEPVPASASNTNDEVIENTDFRRAEALIMLTNHNNPAEISDAWRGPATKYLSTLYSSPDTADQKTMRDAILGVTNLDDWQSGYLAHAVHNGSEGAGASERTVVMTGVSGDQGIQMSLVSSTDVTGKKHQEWLRGRVSGS